MQLKRNTILQGGKYIIIRTIGQGGFGITYLAEQTLTDRLICIKEFFVKEYCERDEDTSQVSLGTRGNEELMHLYMNKFIKEAQTVAKLDNSHIVKIYDTFYENNTAYIVMEYIDGCSLAEQVRDYGPVPEDQAVDYIRQIGSALSYAHGRKVMHLDIKPSNILLSAEGGKAVLIDFGMAKHYGENGEQTSDTPVGLSHGYVPLEQYMEGGVRDFSPSTDIYALGATLLFALTGQRPLQATELAMYGGMKQVEGDFSPEVKEAIKAAMRIKKDERPQSVDSFLALLDANPVRPVSTPGSAPSSVSDETVIQGTTRKNPLHTPKKRSKTWIWALLGGIAAATIVTVIVLDDRAPKTGAINGHKWVDLGLPSRLKWATTNVGAFTAGDFGKYFAWGETAPKHTTDWTYYKWGSFQEDNSVFSYNKYNKDRLYGTVDNKVILEFSDDAARANWGGSWRMPTYEEWKELIEECTWETTIRGDAPGFEVISKTNGESIFLPAAGCLTPEGLFHENMGGFYWSSSLTNEPIDAWSASFLVPPYDSVYTQPLSRVVGLPVRPVSE